MQASPWLAIASKQLELMVEIELTPWVRSRRATQVPSGPEPCEVERDEVFD